MDTYLFYEKYGSLLIQPLIGQYKKGEYSDKLIIKSNKLAAKFLIQKSTFYTFFSYQDMRAIEKLLCMQSLEKIMVVHIFGLDVITLVIKNFLDITNLKGFVVIIKKK